MRVMVLVKATADSEMGILPSVELLAAMGRFNQELIKAGILRGDAAREGGWRCRDRRTHGDSWRGRVRVFCGHLRQPLQHDPARHGAAGLKDLSTRRSPCDS